VRDAGQDDASVLELSNVSHVAPKLPQGVLARGHASLVINQASLRAEFGLQRSGNS